MSELRKVVYELLKKHMEADESIVTIDADLAKAHGTFPLRNDFPGRSFDVGIAEANMTSMAAGMETFGYKPYIFSFTPFATRRMADQIAISIAYAGRNVKIFGSDPGVTAEHNGGTHMSVEDVAIMRSIPGIVIVDIIDEAQAAAIMDQIVAHEGIMYVRFPRKTMPDVYQPGAKIDMFKADVLREGSDVTLVANSIMVYESLRAAELLAADGINAEVLSLHTTKPLDEEAILTSAAKTGAVVTAENHSVIGGLYSAVAELLSARQPTRMAAIGFQDRFGEVGPLGYLKEAMHMTGEDIAAAAKKLLKA